MAHPDKLPDIAQHRLDRRSWMAWVGKATVLTLGSGLLARCASRLTPGVESGSTDTSIGEAPPKDGGVQRDAAADAAVATTCPDPFGGNRPFNPASLNAAVFERWPIRTVDEQNLTWILSNWQLSVEGMVATPRVFSFADLIGLPPQNQVVDFHCVEGWSIYDVPWNGIHLSELFKLVQPADGATHVTFHTIDEGYNESLPIEVALAPKTMLAYGIDCATLPIEHGFPLRLVVPKLLAYKSAKYVHRIELTDGPIEGYWVSRGYPYDGEVPESRLREGKY